MKKLFVVLAALVLLTIMACGGGGDSNGGGIFLNSSGGDSTDSGDQTASLTSATIDSSGGVIEVTDKNSPVYGVKIEVPANAVSEPTTFTISEATNLQPPHDYEGVSRGIKVDVSGKLSGYVLVTVPLNSSVSEEDIMICSSFNHETGKWEEIHLSYADYANKSVSFLTNHFSSFKIYIGLKSYSVPTEDSTEFNVIQDSFNFNNTNDSCYGMSNFAVWYFINYSHGLFNHWDKQTAEKVSKEVQDFIFKDTESYVYNIINMIHNKASLLGQAQTMLNLIYYIHDKNQPTVLTLSSSAYKVTGVEGHAVVVYGYKKTASNVVEFYCYNPNKPQEVFIVYCKKQSLTGLWYFSTPYGGNYDWYDAFGEYYLDESTEYQKIYDKYKASTGYTISGQVTYNGTGLAGVNVTLTREGNSAVAVTDANGVYTFIKAANGTYTLSFAASGYSFNPSSVSVEVSGANFTVATDILATSGGIWTKKGDFPGTSERGPLYFTIGGKGYLVISSSNPREFWEYDPLIDTWNQKASLPSGFSFEGAPNFVINDKAYIVVGVTLWQYDQNTNLWTQKNNVPGESKGGAFGFSIGNKGYIGGGSYDGNHFYEYNADSGQWAEKNGIPKMCDVYNYPNLYAVGSVTFTIGTKAYVTGTNMHLWEYDSSADTWTKKLDYYYSVDATYAAAFSIGQKGYFFNAHGEMWEYDPVSNLLTLRSSFPGTPICYPAGFSINSKAYIGLGGIMVDNTCTLTPSQSFWEYKISQ